MNELKLETSPYLLQHANNPVHWKAWNSTTLANAKENQKLILISIGYSACHWCHVMEHESFENEEVANTMNQHFINIKVDREERPDVDAIYMKAVQLMTGRGGWPLNVVCLPDGKPVWGGTYFRKNDWVNTLEQLHELYQSQPEKLIEYAEKLHEGIETLGLTEEKSTEFNITILDTFLAKWQKSFDWEFGGYSRAPKFMMPTNYQFLLQYGFITQNEKLLEYVDLTLTKMAYGGIFDTIDGGFSRYSVDVKWHVPHFEKMAYDNGQLLSLYANAYKLTKNELYKEIIEKTTTFIEKEWLTNEGAFFSALDADSLTTENHLEEGAFYVWKIDEIKNLIQDDFELFSEVFNINDFGHWEHGNYVLIQNKSLDEISEKNHISIDELHLKKKNWEQILYKTREKRPKPRLDDKCITSWNAILLKGFVDAYKALGNENHLKIAIKNAHFIVNKIWSSDGNLRHTYKNEKPSINGFLEDYAFVIDGFIALYEATFDETWLLHSKNLTNYCLDHFYDEKKQLFRFTSDLDEALISNHFELEDNVIPASNSIMASNLFKLSVYFENSHYEEISRQMIAQVVPSIDYPSAFSNWLMAALHFSEYQKELAICGKESLIHLKDINQNYFPSVVLSGSEKKSDLPFLQNRFVENETLFYLCQNKMCLAPKNNISAIYKDLNH
ncbi:thioredoxin domain-containing protein [Flavobacterium azooxidireducens]|uniref:Thioredoxin domain-containing protein n=1 Tax=Flavobacterium azooxidireducens TaxID=1871076 RepID=A0ABY4KLJ8_9FLAO|nr:thioredoxin domain-containing protein [Flavobacterium azooxidireducens]UPQ80092.1 thioredoxin domain-containing protein [Flavobacterium azooxidireducens]